MPDRALMPPPTPPASPSVRPQAPSAAAAARLRLLALLGLAALLSLAAGLAVGSEGFSISAFLADVRSPQAELILWEIRAPRTLGALLVGALLGLAGAIAQGVFRNPLADPFLLGSAAGASLAVVAVLALGSLAGGLSASLGLAQWLLDLGLAGAAFCGALGGVLLTVLLARGAQHSLRLLLAGVVVGVVMGACADLITSWVPAALRGRQAFMLGTTGYLNWTSVALLAATLLLILPIALRLSRLLDALSLGEDSAQSLGLPVARLRLVLLAGLALCTGVAVSQAGLVAFVGLVAPHIVRRFAPSASGFLLLASTCAGAVLLLAADVLARGLIAPRELPVGILTAVLGGVYLLRLMHRSAGR
ncbi:MAG TPA: iron ABC transporter permease [Burkholderiaceae bacterium]|nr:iron ABC transporter permease [Burkholderiaceae bacterium]